MAATHELSCCGRRSSSRTLDRTSIRLVAQPEAPGNGPAASLAGRPAAMSQSRLAREHGRSVRPARTRTHAGSAGWLARFPVVLVSPAPSACALPEDPADRVPHHLRVEVPVAL